MDRGSSQASRASSPGAIRNVVEPIVVVNPAVPRPAAASSRASASGRGSASGRNPRRQPVESDGSSDEEELVSKEHLDFMRSHPMGSILFKLMKDTVDLRTKVGYNESGLSIAKVCKDFHRGIELEQAELSDRLHDTEKSIRDRLLKSKLNCHDAMTSYPPPCHFSETPTLTNAGQQSHVLKLFPMSSGKFSGAKGRDGDANMGIIEFLASMNRAQEVAKLTRLEFENQMLNSTTGKAHSLLVDWFSNGESIEDVYFNLVTNFDKRVSVEDSRAKLANYRAFKSQNLARAESDIMSLASRASTSLPPGPSRTSIYNLESTMALIRSLPAASSATASNTFHSISAELGRAATFTELSKAINVYRHTIDADIRANGAAPAKDKKDESGGRGGRQEKGGRGGSATAYAISGTASGGNKGSGNNSSGGNQGGQNQSSAQQASSGTPKGGQAGQQNDGGQRGRRGRKGRGGYRGKNGGGNNNRSSTY